jgi:hypothetical protein
MIDSPRDNKQFFAHDFPLMAASRNGGLVPVMHYTRAQKHTTGYGARVHMGAQLLSSYSWIDAF